MSLRDAGELSLLENIRARFKTVRSSVITGIGDDCAVLMPGKGRLLATNDLMTEGIHFDLNYTTPYQLGFKLISVNVSDIYAMGGTPEHILLGLALSPKTSQEFLDELLDGIRSALKKYGAALVGGDISSSKGKTALSATVLGRAARPVLRAGARPGDAIHVTGKLGDSACGMAILKKLRRTVDLNRPVKGPVPWKTMKPLLERHLMPEVRKPGAIAQKATAMIDLSDGLFIDTWRLAKESSTGVRIYEDQLPLSSEMLTASAALGLDPLKLAVSGGEDYELLFTAPTKSMAKAKKIGEVTGKGLVFVRRDGSEAEITPQGYRHFR